MKEVTGTNRGIAKFAQIKQLHVQGPTKVLGLLTGICSPSLFYRKLRQIFNQVSKFWTCPVVTTKLILNGLSDDQQKLKI